MKLFVMCNSNRMGTRHLHEILSERMTISGSMQVSGPLWINYGDYGVHIIRGTFSNLTAIGRNYLGMGEDA